MSPSKPTEQQLITFTIEVGAKPLTDGRQIKCPKCETKQDILEFTPLHHVEKYAAFLIPPLKCKQCRHVFCLRP